MDFSKFVNFLSFVFSDLKRQILKLRLFFILFFKCLFFLSIVLVVLKQLCFCFFYIPGTCDETIVFTEYVKYI